MAEIAYQAEGRGGFGEELGEGGGMW